MSEVTCWTYRPFVRQDGMLSRFLDGLTNEQRHRIANAITYVVSAIVILGVVALLLWLDDIWPQQLIPWVPVERL